MEAHPRILRNYVTEDDEEPFEVWMDALGVGDTRARIRTRMNRVTRGNFGECRPVGEGVHELVFDFGPGYRVYFGNDGNQVILLGGGEKSSQGRDIKQAKERWRDYNA